MRSRFRLHEDDWGMIEVLPLENMPQSTQTAAEAARFGEEHRAGIGWSDIYVLPEAEHSIEVRHIPLAELRALVGAWLEEAAVVESGYLGQVEAMGASFAFGSGGRSGAMYGNFDNGEITQLNILRPDEDDAATVAPFAHALLALGEEHSLMLADWWQNVMVDLRDEHAVLAYLQDEAQQEDSGD